MSPAEYTGGRVLGDVPSNEIYLYLRGFLPRKAFQVRIKERTAAEMRTETLYEILGVSRQAGEGEIKKAYRRLSKENHPDAHPGDKAREKRFREVSEAYGILSDREKRRKYNEELQASEGSRPRAASDAVRWYKLNPESKNPLDARDMFEKFMGIKR